MKLSPRKTNNEGGLLGEIGFDLSKPIFGNTMDTFWDDFSNSNYDQQVQPEHLLEFLEFLAERLKSSFKRNESSKEIITKHLKTNLTYNHLKKKILESSKKKIFFFSSKQKKN